MVKTNRFLQFPKESNKKEKKGALVERSVGDWLYSEYLKVHEGARAFRSGNMSLPGVKV